MAERELYNALMVLASQAGARLFRNNTGMGWVGKVKGRRGNRLELESPRPLHAGLCKGSSDLIGWTPVRVTADMVGKTLAVFTAVEAKAGKGEGTKEQMAFLRAVAEAGGIAGIVDDAAGPLPMRPYALSLPAPAALKRF